MKYSAKSRRGQFARSFTAQGGQARDHPFGVDCHSLSGPPFFYSLYQIKLFCAKINVMERTAAADTLQKIGRQVLLKGWVNSRRDHGQLVFVDLRDRSGLVQIVGDQKLGELRTEDVIALEGTVKARPAKLVNSKLPTGEVEVEAGKVTILSRAADLPFEVTSDGLQIKEDLRLKYRYLDLRRPRLAANLKKRHQMVSFIRRWLDERGFWEVETPILTKATPEGARDFLVPSRLQPGQFYALPQSPQQYKQLLMVAGVEKYFQIARCFRDEDPRADRAYGEFTQLDLELSFTDQAEILSLTEQLFTSLVEQVLGKKILQKPFPKFTYQEAVKQFGDDKFDLRDQKQRQDPDLLAFAWVVDFPLFEKTETRQLRPSHHPFTAPKDEDLPLLDQDPVKVRSWQHDLVCNGHEIAGGSLRITDPQVQHKIFEILGHTQQEIQQKFGHLLEAFRYGVPPHGGIAFGIDRALAVFLGEPSLREVMAFPLNASGQTAVMDAPSPADAAQLKELAINVRK